MQCFAFQAAEALDVRYPMDSRLISLEPNMQMHRCEVGTDVCVTVPPAVEWARPVQGLTTFFTGAIQAE